MGPAATANNRPWKGGSIPIWHPDGQCFLAPLRRGGLHRDMVFSAAWSVQDSTPLRRQRWDFTHILQEIYRRSQPLLEAIEESAVPHQHYLVDISFALSINIMHSAGTGGLEEFQEVKPLMTRGTAQQQPHKKPHEVFRQAKMDNTKIFCSRTA